MKSMMKTFGLGEIVKKTIATLMTMALTLVGVVALSTPASATLSKRCGFGDSSVFDSSTPQVLIYCQRFMNSGTTTSFTLNPLVSSIQVLLVGAGANPKFENIEVEVDVWETKLYSGMGGRVSLHTIDTSSAIDRTVTLTRGARPSTNINGEAGGASKIEFGGLEYTASGGLAWGDPTNNFVACTMTGQGSTLLYQASGAAGPATSGACGVSTAGPAVDPAGPTSPSLFKNLALSLPAWNVLGAGGLLNPDGVSVPAVPYSNSDQSHGLGGGFDVGFGGGSVGARNLVASSGLIVIRYEPFDAYFVSLNANGGALSPSTFLVAPNQSLTLPTPTRTGSWDFLGWWTSASGLGNLIGMAGDPFTPDGTFSGTLFGRWAESITTSFVPGHGLPAIDPVVSRSAFNLPSPTRAGYVLENWWTLPALGSRAGVGGASYTPDTTRTLYARWLKTSTVTFEYNGATAGGSPADSLHTEGTPLTLPSPTKTNLTFAGWYSDANLTTRVAGAGASYSPTDAITLYAGWSYRVSFSGNGVSNPGSLDYLVGRDPLAPITLPTPANRPGFTFQGWFNFDPGSKIGDAGELHTPLADGTQLFAQWEAVPLEVSFNYNGATSGNSTASLSFAVGDPALVLPTPTRSPYDFEGWYSSNTFAAETKVGVGGGDYSPQADTALFARWVSVVTYDYNEATSSNTTLSSTVTLGSSVVLPTPLKAGYTFAGWFSDENTLTQQIGSGGATFTPTGPQTIYAKWLENTVVTFDYRAGDGPTAAVTGAQPGTLTFISGGSALTLPDPTRAGLVLDGWYSSNSFSAESKVGVGGGSYTPGSAVTLFAGWAFEVSYSGNGVSDPQTTNFLVGLNPSVSLVLPTPESRAGFVFDGWYSDNETFLQRVGSAGGTYTPTGAGELFAKWSPVPSGGGSNNSPGSTVTPPQSGLVFGGANVALLPSFTSDGRLIIPGINQGQQSPEPGRVFGGWSCLSTDGSSQVLRPGATVSGSFSGACSPRWETPRVVLNVNGGEGGNSVIRNRGRDSVAVPNSGFSRPGFVFAGWNSVQDGSGSSFSDGERHQMSSSLSLFAQWRPVLDTLKVTRFAPDSPRLNSAIKREIRLWLNSVPDGQAVSCIGSTRGLVATRSDRSLAAVRADRVCSFISARAEGIRSVQLNTNPASSNTARARNVVVTLG